MSDLPPMGASSGPPPPPHSRKVPSLAWRCFVSFLRIGLLLLIMLAWFQRSLIYHPAKSQSLKAGGAQLPQAVVDVTVKSHDGLTLNGWIALAGQKKSALPVDTKKLLSQGHPLVIVFSGNAGNRANRTHLLYTFGVLGADAMIFDYRGYGDNPGKPSEANFLRDARVIWNHATKELNVPARRIVLYGESLGAGTAVQLAGDLCREGIEPGGLVVQSSFNSLVDAGRHHFPILPVGLVLIDRFESERHIAGVKCPILQLHGSRDQIVPLRLGQKLFEAAPAKSSGGIARQQLILPNADHNDVYGVDRPLVVDALKKFLKTVSTPTAR
ncbi:MAG: alpha/beta hydrolase [Planctomycetota bacterium]